MSRIDTPIGLAGTIGRGEGTMIATERVDFLRGYDASDRREGSASDPASPSVIVVDDVPAVCDLVRDTLRGSAVASVGYTDPRQALAAVGRSDRSILVTDFQMPEMNGLELIAAARQLVGPERVAGIVLSSNPTCARFAVADESIPVFDKTGGLYQIAGLVSAMVSGAQL